MDALFLWSGWADLNCQPFAPHANALANCATPRMLVLDFHIHYRIFMKVACILPLFMEEWH